MGQEGSLEDLVENFLPRGLQHERAEFRMRFQHELDERGLGIEVLGQLVWFDSQAEGDVVLSRRIGKNVLFQRQYEGTVPVVLEPHGLSVTRRCTLSICPSFPVNG